VQIKINNEQREVSAPVSISELLVNNRVEMPDMVSVQLNGAFVKKEAFASTLVQENDEVDFLYFMGGGQAGFATRAIHSKPLREDAHRSLHFPVYESVSFDFSAAEELEKAFSGRKPLHMYSRITNPTVENLEQKVKLVTDSLGVVALSSGMAAITNLVMAIAGSGDNIITSRHLFGNTYSLFEQTLKPWGLEVQYARLTDPAQVKALINGKTRAIFLETITNPQMEVADIGALSVIARAANIPLVVDTTVTPPYLFRSRDFGVDVEVLSSTKFISGGATSVGGLIIDNGSFDWSRNARLAADAVKYGPFTLLTRLKREVFRNMGACLSPQGAYLQSLGLETLPLRADKACANTLEIARHLKASASVKSVNYPGLESSPFYETAKKQFGSRPGALLTFDLESKEQCFQFMNRLKVIRRATNLHDNKTLILHPASTIFCEYPPELRREMGVGEDLVRLAAGIEDAADLLEDIDQALGVIQ